MKKKVYQVPALTKTLDILELLGRTKEASFTEIHTKLNIPKSSAFQILNTLKSRGYIRHAGESLKFSLGFRLFELGMQAVSRLDIRAEALPSLRDLMMKTKQTCHLAILDETEGVYLVKVEGTQPVRLNSWEGRRLPLHSTSMGKVLLAWQDPAKLDEILKKIELTRFTERTITSPAKFKKHLEAVRERGWALDDEENELHIRCLGSPVRNIRGEVVAAISISGLASQIDASRLLEFPEMLKETCRQLSEKIGSKFAETQ
jgi:DNA-binding IclR family transcriptional regulator